jgi:hypothetical protein
VALALLVLLVWGLHRLATATGPGTATGATTAPRERRSEPLVRA